MIIRVIICLIVSLILKLRSIIIQRCLIWSMLLTSHPWNICLDLDQATLKWSPGNTYNTKFSLHVYSLSVPVSRNQIVRLYSRFTNLDKSNNGYLRYVCFNQSCKWIPMPCNILILFFFMNMQSHIRDVNCFSREDFLRIPELAINPLGDRIVHAFFKDG